MSEVLILKVVLSDFFITGLKTFLIGISEVSERFGALPVRKMPGHLLPEHLLFLSGNKHRCLSCKHLQSHFEFIYSQILFFCSLFIYFFLYIARGSDRSLYLHGLELLHVNDSERCVWLMFCTSVLASIFVFSLFSC